MVSPGLADTEVAVEQGRVAIEVLNIHRENNIRIRMNDTNTKLLNTGLYDFDATQNMIRVFKGKADVYAGDHRITLTRGQRELSLNFSGRLKTQEFDTRKYEDEFFRWSALRSGYVSEASVDESARLHWRGTRLVGPGWYWAVLGSQFLCVYVPSRRWHLL